jgi:hypothetical protein
VGKKKRDGDDRQGNLFAMLRKQRGEAHRASRAARDEALERVETNASDRWMIEYRKAIERVAHLQEFFSADDVVDDFNAQPSPPRQHEPRASGPVTLQAVRDGVIELHDKFVNSRRPTLHASPIRVYRSLLFKQGDQTG